MIIVIMGPTGVGKTKLSVELAKKYKAEVINGDAVQVYRGLDIGSAKVTEEEKQGIKHHLFDIRDVWKEYSLYDYQRDARNLIDKLITDKKNIIIVGGTGLYIKSVLYNYELLQDDNNDDQYEDKSTDELYQELVKIDKDINIDKNNRRRVVRALNYFRHNGKSISLNKSGNQLLYDAIFIGLTMENRDMLYERINNRVDKMLDAGLIDEVKGFYDKGIKSRPLFSAIGYKELYRYFDHEISYQEAVELIKRNSRRYAKRQYTFFNHQFKMKWFNVDIDNFDKTIDEVTKYIDKKEKNMG